MSRKKVEKIKRKDRYAPTIHNGAWKSCHRKSRFSEFEARRKARLFDQDVYECKVCGQYHLTSNRRYGG